MNHPQNRTHVVSALSQMIKTMTGWFSLLVAFILVLIMLSACSKDHVVTLTFDSGNGHAQIITISKDQDVSPPAEPVMKGHTFTGWKTDASETDTFFDPDNIPENDTVYHASFEVNVYRISFITYGGTLVEAMDIAYGTVLGDFPTTSKDGMTFAGWYENSTFTTLFSRPSMPDHDLVLHACFGYTVTFVTNDDQADLTLVSRPGETLAIPDIHRVGHTLENWHTSLDGGLSEDEPWTFSTYQVNNHVTLYAKWRINTYGIHFDTDGGTSIDTISQLYGSQVFEPEAPVWENHVFAGWTTNPETDEPYVFDTMPAESVILYAVWYGTIIFETHGGTAIETLSLKPGAEIAEPDDPIHRGHTFDGWYTDETYSEVFAFQTMSEGTTVIHARWTINTYTLSFDTRGGTSLEDVTLPYGTPLEAYVSTRAGDIQSGWFLEDTFQTRVTTVPDIDIMVYAEWFLEDAWTTIGNPMVPYTFPFDQNDTMTTEIVGGYAMWKYELPYDLWYTVRMWAQDHGYTFPNDGMAGNYGVPGAAPQFSDRLQPVMSITWLDAVIWTNALSEMKDRIPVYYDALGQVLKTDQESYYEVEWDEFLTNDQGGYRLPTSLEWGMAARWRDTPVEGTVLIEGRHWTPGLWASGADAGLDNDIETGRVAWYDENSGPSLARQTHMIGLKDKNHAELHDMSGNLFEICYDGHWINNMLHPYEMGGAFNYWKQNLAIYARYDQTPVSGSGYATIRLTSSTPSS
ncbi:MAG: InlB B-repeat-containing protein [Acholeplasmataceae bacterium]|nr:InlB B-repeat-containing protein [Acholeplasmataceae bacterium]